MLARALSAAYAAYLEDASAYRALYRKYLGVWPLYVPDAPARAFPAEPVPTSLRVGCFPRPPYYYEGQGFEKELLETLAERLSGHYRTPLAIEWIECRPQGMDGGGLEIFTAFDQFLDWLRDDRFEVACAGLLARPGAPIEVVFETMRIFPGALATGRLPLEDLTTREQLVAALAAHPSCELLSTPGGPSHAATQRLTRDVNAAGGAATCRTARVPELLPAIVDRSADLVIGDCLALASLGKGHYLSVDVAPEEAARVVAFSLP